MIHDLQQTQPDPSLQADVLIVGAGAAGIALTRSLVERGKTVTLLEGGGSTLEADSQHPYKSSVTALPHRGLHSGRFRTLGGTTTQWGGQILELDEIDFAPRPWIAGSGWPFSKSTLAPYYAEALKLEGLASALQDDDEVWLDVGQERPHLSCMEAYVSRWCPEPNFARLHRQTLERPDVNVWLHANAVEMMLDGAHVTGVRARTLDGRSAIFRATQYCFALGAIESSRFFLQPRSGSLPWNESNLLGRHFQDHIDLDAAVVTPHSASHFHSLFDAIFLGGFKYNPKIRLNAAGQQSYQTLNAGATFYSSSSSDEILVAMKLTARRVLRGQLGEVSARDLVRLGQNIPALARQTYRYAVKHRAYHPASAELRMRVHCEQEPAGASMISLARERCSLGLLQTELSWRISALELRTLREFISIARKSLEPLATLEPLPELEDDALLVARCEDSFHHMGGMRMHSSPREGVVDLDLKLHGTANAFVCSTAVYPTSGFSNPTHTLLALAVRLAEHLAE